MTIEQNDLEPSGQALPSGTRLEEFVIERVLGSGGFGMTYLARDAILNRQVVIKENLPVQFCFRDPGSMSVAPRHTTGENVENFKWSLENFAKEAAILASLDHSGIVRVLRSFQAFGTAYFVMPYVEGEALDSLITERQKKGQKFSEEELRALLERVLSALAYLHDRGIYHRDIKPGNILITNEGIAVLIDFGSARQRLSERSMTVIESAGYTPFEQLQSRGNVGPWSDLYALAATLVKVMTGEAPPKANDRAFDDPYIPLAERQELASRYSREFLTSIDKALASRIAERWQNAAEWTKFLNGGTAQNKETLGQATAQTASHSAQYVNPFDPQTIQSSGAREIHGSGGWKFYTEISQVPEERRSSSNSAILLISLCLCGLSLLIFLAEGVGPISLISFFLSGLGVLSVLIKCLTGDIYMNKMDENGYLKKWDKGNKIAAIVILVIYGLIIIAIFSVLYPLN